jgi:serine/threonine protein kinase
MILEYADGGTLFEKVRNENLNKKQIKKYFKDVC